MTKRTILQERWDGTGYLDAVGEEEVEMPNSEYESMENYGKNLKDQIAELGRIISEKIENRGRVEGVASSHLAIPIAPMIASGKLLNSQI